MSEKLSRRVCAVCGGNEKSVIYRQEFTPLSSDSLLEGYDVAVCKSCGFCFADDIPSQAEFDRYYRGMSKYENATSGGREAEKDRRRFENISNVIERYVPSKSSRVLELGCATGGLLARLKERGFSSVRGIDPAPASRRIAAEHHGISVETASLFERSAAPASADFVILIGVLEHIRELNSAVQTLSGLMAPAARLFITVPDASQYPHGEDAPFQELSVEHINFFGPISLSNLMLRHGLTPVGIEQAMLQVGPHTYTPVVHGVFAATKDRLSNAPTLDSETPRAMAEYIADSVREDERIREKIAKFTVSTQIIVWGTGAHTLRLLATGGLKTSDITAFVDSNPHYQGKSLREVPIISPEHLKQHSEPVLISSRAFQSEIAQQIRGALGCPNELLLLYELKER